jgi:hypothetical protein
MSRALFGFSLMVRPSQNNHINNLEKLGFDNWFWSSIPSGKDKVELKFLGTIISMINK